MMQHMTEPERQALAAYTAMDDQTRAAVFAHVRAVVSEQQRAGGRHIALMLLADVTRSTRRVFPDAAAVVIAERLDGNETEVTAHAVLDAAGRRLWHHDAGPITPAWDAGPAPGVLAVCEKAALDLHFADDWNPGQGGAVDDPDIDDAQLLRFDLGEPTTQEVRDAGDVADLVAHDAAVGLPGFTRVCFGAGGVR